MKKLTTKLLLIFTVSLNYSFYDRFSFAANYPVKSTEIKSVVKKDNYAINAEYPVFNGKSLKINKKINDVLKKRVNDSIDWFKKNSIEITSDAKNNKTEIINDSELTITYNNVFYSNKIFAVNILVSSYFTGAAHPNTQIYTFNFDMATGDEIKLASIFKKNSNYLKRISDLCYHEVLNRVKKLGEEPDLNWIKDGTYPKQENYQSFNITDKNLIIVFQDYQVTSHADGPPEIAIPLKKLKDILI